MKPYSIFNKYRKNISGQRRKPHYNREPLTQDEIDKIVAMRNEGKKFKVIAETMGINCNTVRCNFYRNNNRELNYF